RPSGRSSGGLEFRVEVVLPVVVPVRQLAPQALLLVAELDALPSGLLRFSRIAGVVVGIARIVARLEVVEEMLLVAVFVDLCFGLTHGVKTLLALLPSGSSVRLRPTGGTPVRHPPTPRSGRVAQL